MTMERTHTWWKLIASLLVLVASLWSQNLQNIGAGKDGPQQAKLSTDTSKSSSVLGKAPVADSNFVIGNEDVLAISVWKEPEISRVIPVRSDGKISLPLIGELQATGKTPKQLQAEITGELQSYISEPEVTVIVQEIKSQRFNILGHVERPGSYLLTPPMTVVDAIAGAGGPREFAKLKGVYILRRQSDGKSVRISFNYKEALQGKRPEQNITLQARDIVVVP
jgi:polysaccharide biosynthesis/export protein